jgi:D-3-phosphoglycerate dehydrogenase / 2-oxoglutarate reductase
MGDRFPQAKNEIRVLLLEGVNQSAVELICESGYTNVTQVSKALDGCVLQESAQGVHLLGIRSRTHLDDRFFVAADQLIAVGCFGVGTNQVDLDAAGRGGIPVFNAPFSNTRSVAELVIGEIVMLLRRVFPRSVAAHAGGWDKSAKDSHEVRGKTLGIVSYGNIGSQLSNLAEAMGMRVIFFDVADKLRHGNNVTNLNDQTSFDRAGNFHSDKLHVTERYTRSSPDVISYEAVINDPAVFTRSWKISMPLYRRQQKNLQLLQGVELVEELL